MVVKPGGVLQYLKLFSVLALLAGYTALPSVIKIGAIFTEDQKDSCTELAFKYGVYRINKDKNILPKTTLIYDIQYVPRDDSFRATKKDHIFDKKSLNYDVYLSIVKPIVESCIGGFNGTIFTYGQTSAGKNYTMMGSDKDPGIILLAIEQLFKKIDHTFQIRVGYIEIYKERIYDLFNDRKRIEIDPNGKSGGCTLSNVEILVESFEKTMERLNIGSFKRKSSPKDENKLSNISHAIFQIMIKSENKTNGTIQRSCLKFVHVAGCEPVTEIRSSDSMLKKADDSNKSLLWLKFVVNELSEGKKSIDFCNATLTKLLQESLSGNSNTAIICNIKLDAVEETIATLKFAEHAKNVRTAPVRNLLYNDRASVSKSSDKTGLSTHEQRMKEMANTKVENLLLRKELNDVKTAFETKTKWFEEQMKAAEFAQQKLLLAQLEEEKCLSTARNDFEQKIKNLNTLNQDLVTRCEELNRSNLEKVLVIQKQKESCDRLKKENSHLKSKNDKLMDKNKIAEGVETGIKRKIERLEDDLTKNIKKLKNELHSKSVESETSSERTNNNNNDVTNTTHTMTVPDNLVGCVIGAGGSIVKSISHRTGAKLYFSERNGDPDRSITIEGTTDSISLAVDLIKEKIKRGKEHLPRNRSK